MPPNFDPALAALPAALAGEFELERELGRGGMGVVYLARDLRLDRQVAVKVLPPDSATSEVRARFLREARTAGQLSHPHIVHIHRADERGDFAFFVMGLVDGENLGQRVKDRGPLTPVDVVRHLREVAWALAYAHARGVIHRDVKPENIMIERGTNRALVTDFGIAQSDRSPSVTGEGHVVGTAHFMSPEQVQGTTLDGRSDLYALGVVGFYLLSGRLPFEGEGATAVLVAHVTRPAPPLLSVAPQVPRALAAVIDRCLSKDPASRFATGEDLSEALRLAMEGAVAAREPVVVSGGHRELSEEQAGLIWRRAAQLQAEAAARLERETRANAGRALGPGTSDGEKPGTASADGTPRTATYRLQDVESAAVEAGISQRFVALALSELPAGDAASLTLEQGNARGRLALSLFGDLRPALSVSRVIKAPAREVLKLMGRTFQGTPYRMTLRDQIGAHPLDGGIIVFKLPDIDASGSGYPFMMLRYGFYSKELRVTMRALEHDRGATEVTVFADLRPGHGVNVWAYGILSGGATVTGAGVGAVVGIKAMALAGALIAAPVAVTGLAVGALALGASRASYRWSLKKATIELEELLAAIDVTLRSRSIFDEDPPLLPPPAASAGGDILVL